jgi:hypothetical protein
VLDFFTHLIKSFGDNAEFVIKPTFHDGMKVGISWKLGMPFTSFVVVISSLGANSGLMFGSPEILKILLPQKLIVSTQKTSIFILLSPVSKFMVPPVIVPF